MIRVTCALIENKGKVLITQRSATMSQPLLWEFPGGKVEPGETEETCLVREIKEELQLDIACGHMLTLSVFKYPNLTIELIPFVCILKGGEIKLLEHATYKWVSLEELKSFKWCPADVPVIEAYVQYRSSENSSLGK